MREQVEDALEEIRSYLYEDGGQVALHDVTPDGTVQLELHLSSCECDDCLRDWRERIEEALKDVIPEVRQVVLV